MKTRIIIVTLMAMLMTSGGLALRPPQPKARTESAAVQPFTYANIVAHFKAARLRATEVQKRCTVFFEGEWKTREIYDYGLFIVENSDEDIQVTFYLTDAHEMNWITEFLDAPFFTKSETQALFNILHGGHDVTNEKVGRFQRVDFHHWKPKHAEIIVFSFTPWQAGR